MEWKNFFRGLLIGASDLIPGVSGGTIAVILGIYNRLIEAISGFFSKQWKKHIPFLLPLAIGMGTALIVLSKVIEYVLEHFYVPTQFFFVGLIIGVIPLIQRTGRSHGTYKISHWTSFFIAAAIVASMAFLQSNESADPIALTLPSAIGLFFSGWLASMAMLLPGVSGSLVLLLLGVYPTAIYALSNFDAAIIGVIGAGVFVGFIISSKAIRHVMAHYPVCTYAIILGLLVGSLFVVFPGLPETVPSAIASVVTLAAGITITLFMSKDRT